MRLFRLMSRGLQASQGSKPETGGPSVRKYLWYLTAGVVSCSLFAKEVGFVASVSRWIEKGKGIGWDGMLNGRRDR